MTKPTAVVIEFEKDVILKLTNNTKLNIGRKFEIDIENLPAKLRFRGSNGRLRVLSLNGRKKLAGIKIQLK